MLHTIIHEDQHVAFGKSMDLFEIISHIMCIVMTATQLSLLTFVIDPNKNRSPHTCRMRRDNVHGLIDIDQSGRRELGNLIVPHTSQNGTHAAQELDPRQVVNTAVLVLIQDLQQCRSAGSTCSASRVGKLKLRDIVHVGTGCDPGLTLRLCGSFCLQKLLQDVVKVPEASFCKRRQVLVNTLKKVTNRTVPNLHCTVIILQYLV